MMRIFPLLICAFIAGSAIGQDNGVPSSRANKINFTKYSLAERLLLFPFTEATQVKMVSFPEQRDIHNKRDLTYADLRKFFQSIGLKTSVEEFEK